MAEQKEQKKEKRRTFALEIITPEQVVVEEEVEAVVLPATEGLMGILRGHAPLIGGLRIGVLKYRQEGKFHWVACDNGFFEVSGNKLRILPDNAERGEMIDVLRARQARDRAKQRLSEKHAGLDYLRAELALQRALARLKAAGAASEHR
jgi:F-type H+-transporting ATPase subunit epsilon